MPSTTLLSAPALALLDASKQSLIAEKVLHYELSFPGFSSFYEKFARMQVPSDLRKVLVQVLGKPVFRKIFWASPKCETQWESDALHYVKDILKTATPDQVAAIMTGM